MNISKTSRIILSFWGVWFALTIAGFFWVRTALHNGDFETVLHYNALVGADVTGKLSLLYRLPVYSLVIGIVNIIIAYFARTYSKILPAVLAVCSLICALALTVALYLILKVSV